MIQDTSSPVLHRFLRAYLRSGLRGSYRLTMLSARWSRRLQAVPIRIDGCPPFHIDLRAGQHELFVGSPWATTPREADEWAVMRAIVRPGDTIFDIGANIGLHTVLLAKLTGSTGQVHAFEPNAELLIPLRVTVASLDNTTLHECALGDQDATATLFVPEDASMGSLADWTVGRIAGAEATRKLGCAVRQLDHLVATERLPRPDLIKCDVEGYELSVFAGATTILNRADAPIVLFEADENTARGFGRDVDAARAFLGELGEPRYHFFEITAGGQLTPKSRCDGVHANFLAVPEARLSRLGSWASTAPVDAYASMPAAAGANHSQVRASPSRSATTGS